MADEGRVEETSFWVVKEVLRVSNAWLQLESCMCIHAHVMVNVCEHGYMIIIYREVHVHVHVHVHYTCTRTCTCTLYMHMYMQNVQMYGYTFLLC